MKKTLLKYLLILLMLSNYSCNKQEENSSNYQKNVISLNNGNPWKANPETTYGILIMKKKMASFNIDSNLNLYSKLVDELTEEFLVIFEKCTMKGESHKQLHNYLLPIKLMFKDLLNSNIKKRQKTFHTLSSHLEKYKYFFY